MACQFIKRLSESYNHVAACLFIKRQSESCNHQVMACQFIKRLRVMKSSCYGLLVHKKTVRVMQSSRYGLLDHKKAQNRRQFLISVPQDFFDVIIVLWKITNLIYLKLFQAINLIRTLIEIHSVLESNPKFDIQGRKKLNEVE